MTKRILLSAFACDPQFGSDEEVGWQWARQLAARGYEVTVVTRASHRQCIEEHVARTGECKNVEFIYVDLPRLHSVLSRINRRNHLYYYPWQWMAYRAAEAAHRECAFDLVHHVTWVSFRQPSFMWRLGIPFFFGPVAGGDEIPSGGYTASFSPKQQFIEVARCLANAVVRWDPMMRTTFFRATRLFFTSSAHLRRVPREVTARAQVELAIGCDMSHDEGATYVGGQSRKGTRLLFVGRCIGWKGMDLGLRAFAHALARDPALTLTIIGDGADQLRWKHTAEQLGVAHAVSWWGWLPKDQVLRHYNEFDLLFYPSLRDSGGFVVLEALQRGLPVVCFRLGGPGVVVDDTCGAAVSADDDADVAVAAYADAVLRVLDRVRTDPMLNRDCRARAEKFTWTALIERIYGPDSMVEERA